MRRVESKGGGFSMMRMIGVKMGDMNTGAGWLRSQASLASNRARKNPEHRLMGLPDVAVIGLVIVNLPINSDLDTGVPWSIKNTWFRLVFVNAALVIRPILFWLG